MKKIFSIVMAVTVLGGCSLFQAAAPDLYECFEGSAEQTKSLDSTIVKYRCRYEALKPVLTESGACEVIRGEKTVDVFLKELDPRLAFKVKTNFEKCGQ